MDEGDRFLTVEEQKDLFSKLDEEQQRVACDDFLRSLTPEGRAAFFKAYEDKARANKAAEKTDKAQKKRKKESRKEEVPNSSGCESGPEARRKTLKAAEPVVEVHNQYAALNSEEEEMEEEPSEPVIRVAVSYTQDGNKKEEEILVPVIRDAVTNTVHEKKEDKTDPPPEEAKKTKKMTVKQRRQAFMDAVREKEQKEKEEEEKKKKAAAAAAERRPPPIIAEGQGLPKVVAARLRAGGVSFMQEPGRVSTRVVTTTLKDFEATKQVLKELKMNFFTYAATPQLTVTRILKRIPLDYSAAEVQEELKRTTGHTVDVGEMTGWTRETEREERTRTRRLPMFRVTATPEQMEELQRADLFHTKAKNVMWEKPRRIPIIQCYRCQRFGHTAQHCSMPERCVKCPEQHERGACTNNDKRIKAWCVNCGLLGHPASWKECPKYLLALRRLDERNKRESALEDARAGRKTREEQPAKSYVRSRGMTYAQAFGNEKQRTQGPSEVEGPVPLEKTRGPDTQELMVPLSLGATLGGIPVSELLTDRLVGELLNLKEEERDFALFRHYMMLKLQYATPQVTQPADQP